MKAYPNAGGLKATSRATIYFAQRGPYVKVGISRDPERRIRALRYGNCIAPTDADRSQPVRLLHTIPDCTLGDEHFAQARFKAWHAAGEWFHLDADFLAELERVVEETTAGDTPLSVLARQYGTTRDTA